MDCTTIDIVVGPKIIFVDGAPDCFALEVHSLEHMDSWIHTPQDVNLEGDAYANGDAEDHSNDPVINYDCIAWRS
jgi:hypothetical protein